MECASFSDSFVKSRKMLFIFPRVPIFNKDIVDFLNIFSYWLINETFVLLIYKSKLNTNTVVLYFC